MLTWEEIEIQRRDAFAHYQIIRRKGAVVSFEAGKSTLAFLSAVFFMEKLTNSTVALNDLRSFARQRLGMVNLTQKSSGFFSASKANLRNAP
jgi:hypothetical protein